MNRFGHLIMPAKRSCSFVTILIVMMEKQKSNYLNPCFVFFLCLSIKSVFILRTKVNEIFIRGFQLNLHIWKPIHFQRLESEFEKRTGTT